MARTMLLSLPPKCAFKSTKNVPCACSISCIAVEQSDDTVAAVEVDAMYPWLVISVPSVILDVDGFGRAGKESENIKDTNLPTG